MLRRLTPFFRLHKSPITRKCLNINYQRGYHSKNGVYGYKPKETQLYDGKGIIFFSIVNNSLVIFKIIM